MCDFNPVHYLFATGTSEVSTVYVCANVSVCALNTVLKTFGAFVGIWFPHKSNMVLVATCKKGWLVYCQKKWSQYRDL